MTIEKSYKRHFSQPFLGVILKSWRVLKTRDKESNSPQLQVSSWNSKQTNNSEWCKENVLRAIFKYLLYIIFTFSSNFFFSTKMVNSLTRVDFQIFSKKYFHLYDQNFFLYFFFVQNSVISILVSTCFFLLLEGSIFFRCPIISPKKKLSTIYRQLQ